MKYILIYFILFPQTVFTQRIPTPIDRSQTATTTVSGNQNIVWTIQGNNNITIYYNLRDEKDAEKFLTYLRSLPGITDGIKNLLKNSKATLDYVSKIYKVITDEGFLNPDKLLERFESLIRENERLRTENERMKSITSDPGFSKVMEEANLKLNKFDNEGYQRVLQDYENLQRNKLQEHQELLGRTAYLLALNSFINYNYDSAFSQINRAIIYYERQEDYYMLKSLIYLSTSKYIDAIQLIKRRFDPNNDIYKSLWFNSLGCAYQENGSLDSALHCYLSALKYLGKSEFPDDIDSSDLYNNLSTLYKDKGNFIEAVKYQNASIDVRTRKSGKNNYQIALSYHNLAAIYREKRDYINALKFNFQALELREKIFGTNHIITSDSYNNLGAIYRQINDYEKAIRYAGLALNIREKLLGRYHHKTAISYNNLAVAFQASGMIDSALIYYEVSLDISTKVLGTDHVKLTEINLNLGELYLEKENFPLALVHYTKALVMAANNLDPLHYKIGIVNFKIAKVFQKTRCYYSSFQYYGKALKILNNEVNAGNPSVSDIYKSVGDIYSELNDNGRAIENYEAALTYHSKIKSKDSASISLLLMRLGHAYQQKGDYDRSIAHLTQGLRIEEARNQPDNIIHFCFGLGASFYLNGKYNFSDSVYKKALDLSIEHLGPQHFSTQQICLASAATLMKLGKLKDVIARINMTGLESAEIIARMLEAVENSISANTPQMPIDILAVISYYLSKNKSHDAGFLEGIISYYFAWAYCNSGYKLKGEEFFKKALKSTEKNDQRIINNLKFDTRKIIEKCEECLHRRMP